MEKQSLEERLESIIDSYGIRETLSTLSNIADGKGAHLESNWQESGFAWYKLSRKLEEAWLLSESAGLP